MADYLQLAKDVVARASGNGAEVEVLITRGSETTIRISMGEIEQLVQSGARGMGVRVIEGGRTGYAYTSDFSDSSIDETWQSAVELAKVATPDEHRGLPEPQTIPDAGDLEIWDDNLEHVPTEDKVALLTRLERAALDYDERVIGTQFATYQDSVDYVHLANSRGFAGEYGRTVVAGFLMGVARDANGNASTAFGLNVSNYFDDIDPDAIGQEAARKAVSMLGGKPVDTQVGTVVLDPFVGAQIIGALSRALTAESWQKKQSFLLDRLGQSVGNDMVTLMDNGRLKRGLASAPFDGEGVPTSATRLIDEGVLQNLVYDTYTASKDGRVSTGNAQRDGHRSLPTLGMSNFYMQPGQISAEDIIANVDKGFYVLTAMQTGGIDPVTGDCSMAANGLWIEDGKIGEPVSGVTIAMTLDGFLKGVAEVGSDLRMIPMFGNIGVPTLRVDNVTIGGN